MVREREDARDFSSLLKVNLVLWLHKCVCVEHQQFILLWESGHIQKVLSQAQSRSSKDQWAAVNQRTFATNFLRRYGTLQILTVSHSARFRPRNRVNRYLIHPLHLHTSS